MNVTSCFPIQYKIAQESKTSEPKVVKNLSKFKKMGKRDRNNTSIAKNGDRILGQKRAVVIIEFHT